MLANHRYTVADCWSLLAYQTCRTTYATCTPWDVEDRQDGSSSGSSSGSIRSDSQSKQWKSRLFLQSRQSKDEDAKDKDVYSGKDENEAMFIGLSQAVQLSLHRNQYFPKAESVAGSQQSPWRRIMDPFFPGSDSLNRACAFLVSHIKNREIVPGEGSADAVEVLEGFAVQDHQHPPQASHETSANDPTSSAKKAHFQVYYTKAEAPVFSKVHYKDDMKHYMLPSTRCPFGDKLVQQIDTTATAAPSLALKINIHRLIEHLLVNVYSSKLHANSGPRDTFVHTANTFHMSTGEWLSGFHTDVLIRSSSRTRRSLAHQGVQTTTFTNLELCDYSPECPQSRQGERFDKYRDVFLREVHGVEVVRVQLGQLAKAGNKHAYLMDVLEKAGFKR